MSLNNSDDWPTVAFIYGTENVESLQNRFNLNLK